MQTELIKQNQELIFIIDHVNNIDIESNAGKFLQILDSKNIKNVFCGSVNNNNNYLEYQFFKSYRYDIVSNQVRFNMRQCHSFIKLFKLKQKLSEIDFDQIINETGAIASEINDLIKLLLIPGSTVSWAIKTYLDNYNSIKLSDKELDKYYNSLNEVDREKCIENIYNLINHEHISSYNIFDKRFLFLSKKHELIPVTRQAFIALVKYYLNIEIVQNSRTEWMKIFLLKKLTLIIRLCLSMSKKILSTLKCNQ